MLSSVTTSLPHDDEAHVLAALLGAALHFPQDGLDEWIETLGRENFRVVRLDGRVVAGLGLIDMGQWFGGRHVRVMGVTAVGVAPQHRGSGVGSVMLRRILEELHANGVPLAALYPATVPFYRRAGFERAGQRITYELPLESIDVNERTLELTLMEEQHYPTVRQLYEQRARRVAGNLDRPDWMWQSRLEPRDSQYFRFLVQRDGQPEGYVVWTQGKRSDPLNVVDICVLTPAAGRRLLALFAGSRSMVERVTWHGGPLDPLVYLLREQVVAGGQLRVKITRSLDWMLRIIDVAAALGARGYPPGLRAELHLDVRDDVLSANTGRWVLQVADGDVSVQPGGAGRVRLGVRELAALYTGFMTPAELQAIGAIEGAEADLALAGLVFAGPRPWIADMF